VDQRRPTPASEVGSWRHSIRPVVPGNSVVVDWQDSFAAARHRSVKAAGPRTGRVGSRRCRFVVAVMIYLAGCSETATVLAM